ncbi:ABC transporter permease [Pseudomonas sp. GD03944]|nr:ABC transporter permease [Pseudomonas sp. GD03944]MDH1265128.1 ABC transporter permease [Pseudomonas sp. GD03944]
MTVQQPTNRVIPLLVLLALAALWGLDAASVQPNRIMPGSGLGLVRALGLPWALALSAMLLLCGALAVRDRARWVLAAVCLLVLQLPLSLAWMAARHVGADMPLARLGIGPGTWSLLFLLGLMLIDTQQRLRLPRVGLLGIGIGLLLVTWLIVRLGWLEPLALMREYQTRRAQFSTALYTHLGLVAATLVGSLVLGAGLVALISRFPRLQGSVIGGLSLIQTIPSLALFGLLLAPLSYLSSQFPLLQQWGIRGIGWAPALLALVAYSLLPIVRNTCVALQGVEASVIEAARGMGMGPLQVFFQARLPLAMPVIIEGLRVTTLQAIGLTAVAALIGAGGFGTFIFQGLGQSAMDLIVLGALPILLMALLADGLFSLLADGWRGGAER